MHWALHASRVPRSCPGEQHLCDSANASGHRKLMRQRLPTTPNISSASDLAAGVIVVEIHLDHGAVCCSRNERVDSRESRHKRRVIPPTLRWPLLFLPHARMSEVGACVGCRRYSLSHIFPRHYDVRYCPLRRASGRYPTGRGLRWCRHHH